MPDDEKTLEERIEELEKRVKKLESRLGAVGIAPTGTVYQRLGALEAQVRTVPLT
jgi:hypothetical protein